MKQILSILLLTVVLSGCLPPPPPPRSDVTLSDAARGLQEAQAGDDTDASTASTTLAAFLQSMEVPPHPRSELTLAELGKEKETRADETTASADDGPVFSAIPPPHPRVDADGQDVAGTDGLVAHAPLVRPTLRPTVDFGAAIGEKNEESAEGSEAEDEGAAESRQVASVTLTPLSTETPIPATATATLVPPTPTSTEIPPMATATDLPPTPTAEPTSAPIVFNVVPEESTISYQVYEEFTYVGGTERLVNGKTQQVIGALVLSLGEPPTLESGYFEVNIASMTSRDPRRDLAIRSNWLESERYPIARFEIDELRNGPQSWVDGEAAEFQLEGQLTLRNMTKEVIFDVNATLTEGAILGSASTTILMTDYGFEPPAVANLVEAGNEVTVIVYLSAAAE